MPLPRTKLLGFTFVTVGIAVYGIWALWFSTRTERPVNIPILMTIRNQPRRLPKEDFEQVLHRPIETAGLGPGLSESGSSEEPRLDGPETPAQDIRGEGQAPLERETPSHLLRKRRDLHQEI